MPLPIIIPRKRPSTLITLKRPLTRMTPLMTPQMKAPRKPLITQIAPPLRRTNDFGRRGEIRRLVRHLRMEQLLVLLEILIRREAELRNRAVGEDTGERPVVAVEVLVAGLGVLEAFVEVEAGWARTFEVPVAVESSELVGMAGE